MKINYSNKPVFWPLLWTVHFKSSQLIFFNEFFYFWSGGSISSPVRYLYLSVLPDDNADISAVSLLILYHSFWSLMFSSVVMISFYIFSKRFFLKRKRLSDERVFFIAKNTIALQYIFCKDSKASTWWMTKYSLLKPSLVWNFHNEIVCRIYSCIFWCSRVSLCDKNKGKV